MKELGDIYKDNPRSIVFARYAEELVREGKIERAVEILKKGIEYHPQYAPGHSVLATMYFMQDMPAEAAKELEQSINLDPQMPSDLFRLGEYYLKDDLAVKAVTCLWAAYRFETENGELAATYEKAEELRLTQQDLHLDEQSQRALSELTADKKPLAETIVAVPSKAKAVSADGAKKTAEDAGLAEASTATEALPDLGDEVFEPAAAVIEDTESVSDAASETGEMSEDVSDLMKMAFGDEDTQFSAGDETTALADEGAEALEEEELFVDEDTVSGFGLESVETGEPSDLEPETNAEVEAENVAIDDDLTAYLKGEYTPGKTTAEPSVKLAETVESPEEPVLIVDPGAVTDEEFDALIDEGAPDISDLMADDDAEAGEKEIEPLPVDDSAFELDLTDHIDSFEDRRGESEPALNAGDVDFDQLIEQDAPDIGPIEDHLLEFESEDETFSGEMPTETGEEDYAGSIIVDQEDVSFEEEIAGLKTDDDSEGPIEPVGPGSGDQPEAIGVHEIEDDAAYNPVDFAFGTSSGEVDEPVLTDEERRELMAFETIADEDTDFTSTGSDTAIEKEDELPGLDEESSAAGIETEDEDELFMSELTREEIDVLSVTGTEADEPDGALEAEMRDGIDYSDVLPGETGGVNIEDSLDEAADEDIAESESMASEFDFTVSETVTEMETETETETEQEQDADSVGGFGFDDDAGAGDSIEAASPELEPVNGEKSSFDQEAVEVDEAEESADDSLRFVEDMIKSAPGIEIETDPDEDAEENDLSLDDLIVQYEQSIKESGASNGESRIVPMEPSSYGNDVDLSLEEDSDTIVSDADNAAVGFEGDIDADNGVRADADVETDFAIDETAEETFDINIEDDGGIDLQLNVDDDEGDVTPTMAEIYVAQGLFEQAMRMYETIIRKQPENDRARSRLRELRGLYGQEAGDA